MFTELLELFEPLFPILATSILFIGGVALAIYGLVLVCKGLKLLFKKTISNMSLCADCIKNWIDSGFERLENTIKSAIKSANRSQTEDILKLVQPMVERWLRRILRNNSPHAMFRWQSSTKYPSCRDYGRMIRTQSLRPFIETVAHTL